MNANQENEFRIAPLPHLSVGTENTIDITSDIQWQLYTLMGTSLVYFLFFIILSNTLGKEKYACFSLVPLILYDLIKIIFCIIKITKHMPRDKECIRDITESIFMTIYKIGIIIKIVIPEVNSIHLIIPIVVMIIIRIVMSMGIYGELKSIYRIVILN